MNLIFRLADAAKVFLQSGRGLTYLLKKGVSIASTQLLYNCKRYIPEVNTILDVGANRGQFALSAIHFYPAAGIHSFEPIPAVYNTLQQNTRKQPLIRTYNFALGSSTGTLEFYCNNYSLASSALHVSSLQQQLMPQTAAANQIKVPVKCMDDLLPGMQIKSPVLLKLDVQGFEKEVLKGAIRSLGQIDYLLFEASFVPMYEGEPLFDEMHNYVKELGFEFIAPVGFLQTDALQILQMDLLYKRKSSV
jgi:FkbM family methyltransferase